MKKSLFDLAIEYTGHDKNNLTEFQENEINALVKFGECVIENAADEEMQQLKSIYNNVASKLNNANHKLSEIKKLL